MSGRKKPQRQMIDQRAQFSRSLSAGGPQYPKLPGVLHMLVEYPAQATLPDGALNHEVRQTGDPHPGQHRMLHRFDRRTDQTHRQNPHHRPLTQRSRCWSALRPPSPKTKKPRPTRPGLLQQTQSAIKTVRSQPELPTACDKPRNPAAPHGKPGNDDIAPSPRPSAQPLH